MYKIMYVSWQSSSRAAVHPGVYEPTGRPSHMGGGGRGTHGTEHAIAQSAVFSGLPEGRPHQHHQPHGQGTEGIRGLIYIYGLAQDCGNFSALAMELLQACARPSISVGNSHRPASPRPTTLEEDRKLFVDFSSILCLRFETQAMRTYNFLTEFPTLPSMQWFLHRNSNWQGQWYPFKSPGHFEILHWAWKHVSLPCSVQNFKTIRQICDPIRS